MSAVQEVIITIAILFQRLCYASDKIDGDITRSRNWILAAALEADVDLSCTDYHVSVEGL